MLWLNLLNMWFGLWQKRVQTHWSLVNTPGPLQGKAWVRMLAFKPKITCLSFFFSRYWWSILKKNYINDVLSENLDFSYHCGGWKNRTIFFLLEKHNFKAISTTTTKKTTSPTPLEYLQINSKIPKKKIQKPKIKSS